MHDRRTTGEGGHTMLRLRMIEELLLEGLVYCAACAAEAAAAAPAGLAAGARTGGRPTTPPQFSSYAPLIGKRNTELDKAKKADEAAKTVPALRRPRRNSGAIF